MAFNGKSLIFKRKPNILLEFQLFENFLQEYHIYITFISSNPLQLIISTYYLLSFVIIIVLYTHTHTLLSPFSGKMQRNTDKRVDKMSHLRAERL